MFVSPSKASRYYQVSTETLRKWALSGKIKHITTNGGHHRYEIVPNNEHITNRKSYIYARVSSSKQKKDLEKQVQYLKQKFPTYEVIQDIGSGVNFKRKGLLFLVESVFSGNVKEIAIAHPDRLTRVGYEFICFICKHFHTKLRVLSSKKDSTNRDDFTKEFISIITYYTSKFYGMRRYNVRTKN